MATRWTVLLCLLAFLLDSQSARTADPAYDLVIRGGKVVDGTGNPWRLADVAVVGDRVAAIGRIAAGTAKREIDASGLIVAPGFIDIHSHSDYLLLEDGRALSKIYQGVTTELLGEGNSVGPHRGPLPPSNSGSSSVRFATLSKYFEALEHSGTAVNVATYVGLDNLWQSVMGSSFERPTDQQFAEMEKLLDEAMRDGAFGLSSMLAMPPGALATKDDIVRLCRVVHEHGGIYSSHIRHEGTDVVAAVEEAIAIGELAHVPVDIIHLKIADQSLWGNMRQLVVRIEAARSRGVNVQANVYPYTRGNNNLASIIPPWAHEGGTEKMLERLNDPALRARMKREIQAGLPGWYNHYTAIGGDWSRMLISGKSPYEGLTMDRVLELRNQKQTQKVEPIDELFDILREHSGSVPTVYEHHTEADMTTALVQPWCSIGSDGSAYAVEGPLRRGNPHPRNFGTFPRVLGHYVRDSGLLRLEDAVRKMTSLNAQKIGLVDRGQLRPGAFADITMFSTERIADKSTYEAPFQYSQGIELVIVNGQVVLEKGAPTGAKPGKPLRHQ